MSSNGNKTRTAKELPAPTAPTEAPLTNSDVRRMDNALLQLRQMPMRPAMAMRISYCIKLLMPAFEALGEHEEKIRRKHQKFGPEGALRAADGRLVFNDGYNTETLETDLEELFNAPADQIVLPRAKFRGIDFEQSAVMVTPDTLLNLGPLMVLEDEPPPTEKKP